MENEKNNYINSVNLNADSNFPYLVLNVVNDESYPRNSGFHVMHWHEDLQFIYVLDGEIEVKTLDASFRVGKKGGIFLNKNVIHLVNKISSCHYHSFIFPDYFLKFYVGSPASGLVEQIVNQNAFPVCCFPSDEEWCKPILDVLAKLSELETHKSEYYAYEVLCSLSQLWLALCQNVSIPAKSSNGVISLRMQQFLQYISTHYGEDVSLEQIASSANVSKSECLRCFKTCMNTTPYQYLTEYRLLKAAELLKTTDEPIGVIADCVGFRQVSHFGKCFKEKTGLSPSAYRNKTNQECQKK